MTTSPYVYRIASVHRVVDADSLHLTVSLGLYLTATIPVRLLGVDCPELAQGSPFERRKAREARDATLTWFAVAGTYWVRTERDPDSFGRWLGHVWWERDSDSSVLSEELMNLHLATRWPRRWFEVHDPDRNRP